MGAPTGLLITHFSGSRLAGLNTLRFDLRLHRPTAPTSSSRNQLATRAPTAQNGLGSALCRFYGVIVPASDGHRCEFVLDKLTGPRVPGGEMEPPRKAPTEILDGLIIGLAAQVFRLKGLLRLVDGELQVLIFAAVVLADLV